MKELSACRTMAGGSSLSCSSSISPTICSTMSSIDTSPSVPPYSSTTSARWMREVAGAQIEPGGIGFLALRLAGFADPRPRGHERQQVADVNDAFGIVEG